MSREIQIRILPSVEEAAKKANQSEEDWLDDWMTIATGIDKGVVFQLVGGNYLKLSMADIRPYSESWGNTEGGKIYPVFEVRQDTYKKLKDKSIDFRTWVLKVINLGLMGPNMNLHFFDSDDGEYHEIVF